MKTMDFFEARKDVADAVAAAVVVVLVVGPHLHYLLLPVCQEDGAALRRVISLLCLRPLCVSNKDFPSFRTGTEFAKILLQTGAGTVTGTGYTNA
mmetsp:Transcript_3720/g.5702  ORF Transcript_3720/g.5702 Transcript_3720/m.5702 type:complete len:95 (-) Transcript_3720:6-290(-)